MSQYLLMLVRLVLILSVLCSCAPSDRLQRSYAHGSDVWQTVSRDTEVYRDRDVHVLARAIILEASDETRYYLSLSFLHARGARPEIMTVSQDGLAMPYQMFDRRRTYCIDHCHSVEVGQIPLTVTQFREAANDGMTLDVTGKHRDYPAQIPSRLFFSALQAANLLEPAAKPLP